MDQAYFFQSTAAPVNKLHPNHGNMICVSSDKCKYGTKCIRECWSVAPFTQGGECYKKGSHRPVHWHIKHNAKWTNCYGTILPFNLM